MKLGRDEALKEHILALSLGEPAAPRVASLFQAMANDHGAQVTPSLRRAAVAALLLNARRRNSSSSDGSGSGGGGGSSPGGSGGGGVSIFNASEPDTQSLLLSLHLAHRRQALEKKVVELTHVSKTGGSSLCLIAAARNGMRTEDVGSQNCVVRSFGDEPRWYDSAVMRDMLLRAQGLPLPTGQTAPAAAGQAASGQQAALGQTAAGQAALGQFALGQAATAAGAGGGVTVVADNGGVTPSWLTVKHHKLRGVRVASLGQSASLRQEGGCRLPPANKPRLAAGPTAETGCRERRDWLLARRYSMYANEYTALGGRESFEGVQPCTSDMVTVLQVREPRARLESHVKHFWRMILEFCQSSLTVFVPLLKEVSTWTQLMVAPLNNYAIRSLLGEAVFNAPMGCVGPEHLEAAKGVALQYDVLMRLEDPPGSELAMRMGLGWCTRWAVRAQVSNPLQDAGLPLGFDKAWAEEFAALNTLDQELYNWISVLVSLDELVYTAAMGAGWDDSRQQCRKLGYRYA